jgi:hypothetical protein
VIDETCKSKDGPDRHHVFFDDVVLYVGASNYGRRPAIVYAVGPHGHRKVHCRWYREREGGQLVPIASSGIAITLAQFEDAVRRLHSVIDPGGDV